MLIVHTRSHDLTSRVSDLANTRRLITMTRSWWCLTVLCATSHSNQRASITIMSSKCNDVYICMCACMYAMRACVRLNTIPRVHILCLRHSPLVTSLPLLLTGARSTNKLYKRWRRNTVTQHRSSAWCVHCRSRLSHSCANMRGTYSVNAVTNVSGGVHSLIDV